MEKQEVQELMSISELGRVLGLKKTDSYWLVHKDVFEVKMFLGKMWITRDSFEKWYANQAKYHKVNGEEPGRELKESSYSVRDISQMLGVHEATVYEIIKRDGIETIEVDKWRRVPREAFDAWYKGQTRYLTMEDRKKAEAAEHSSITMPEMAALLGIDRRQVYEILKDPLYKDWFEFVYLADRKRITRESFYRFLDGQTKYFLVYRGSRGTEPPENNRVLANYRGKMLLEGEIFIDD